MSIYFYKKISTLRKINTTIINYYSALKTIPACQKSAEWLAGQMQKAVVILGSLRLLRAHDSGIYNH